MNQTLPSVLTDFAAFLRGPRLLVPSGLRAAEARRDWAMLLAMYVGVLLLIVLPLIKAWQTAFALPSPDAFGKISPMLLVPLVVLAAPLAEEIIFRGWQTGRPRALWLVFSVLLGAGAIMAAQQAGSDAGVVLSLLAVLFVIAGGWTALRKRRAAPRWFEAAYPVIFYLVAGGFALAHLGNYPAMSLVAVPMILPQLWAALVLGFMRMRFGLFASILAHGLSNGAAVGLSLLVS